MGSWPDQPRVLLGEEDEPIEEQGEAVEEEDEDDTSDEAVGCVCLRDSCADEWPISTIDADVRRGKPYACVLVYRSSGEVVMRMDVYD